MEMMVNGGKVCAAGSSENTLLNATILMTSHTHSNVYVLEAQT